MTEDQDGPQSPASESEPEGPLEQGDPGDIDLGWEKKGEKPQDVKTKESDGHERR